RRGVRGDANHRRLHSVDHLLHVVQPRHVAAARKCADEQEKDAGRTKGHGYWVGRRTDAGTPAMWCCCMPLVDETRSVSSVSVSSPTWSARTTLATIT